MPLSVKNETEPPPLGGHDIRICGPVKRRAWGLRTLVLLVVCGVVGWLLYRELRHHSFAEVRDGLLAVPARTITAAVGLTVLNYLILVGYDWLAVRSIGNPLPLWRIAFASFCGHAVSYNFGAILGGGATRIRLYAAWGLSALDIVRLLAMLLVTFWAGAFALAGVVLLAAPVDVPPDLHLPFDTCRPIGAILLALAIAYLALSALRTSPIQLRGLQLRLPPLRLSIMQIIIAALDLVVAAGVLYTILPPTVEVDFVRFLGIYLLAWVGVVFTHIPGGLGVLELIVLNLIPRGPTPEEHIFAALLVFRIIYLLAPLLIAAALLAAHELHITMQRRREAEAEPEPSSPAAAPVRPERSGPQLPSPP